MIGLKILDLIISGKTINKGSHGIVNIKLVIGDQKQLQ